MEGNGGEDYFQNMKNRVAWLRIAEELDVKANELIDSAKVDSQSLLLIIEIANQMRYNAQFLRDLANKKKGAV